MRGRLSDDRVVNAWAAASLVLGVGWICLRLALGRPGRR
jgi:hypothetical protein